MKSSKGFRHKTRRRLKKALRSKFTPERLMQEFKLQEKVIIKQDPTSQRGMPHPSFKGLNGIIEGRRGDAYVVRVKRGNKAFTLISCPEHLKRV